MPPALPPAISVAAPPPVVVPGPVYRVEVDATTATGVYGFVGALTRAAIDVRLPSGWGFQLVTETFAALELPLIVGSSVGGRVYRVIADGDGTIGAFARAEVDWEIGAGLLGDPLSNLGFDADFVRGTTELRALFVTTFNGTTYQGFSAVVNGRADAGSRIHLEGETAVSRFPGSPLFVVAEGYAGYRAGPLMPYVGFLAGFDFGGSPLDVLGLAGARLEYELGDLPLTLTAEAEIAFQPGFFGWNAAAGFEYAVGNGGPVTLHGGVELGGGGFWSVEAGIGLKLGEGRLSGFRELDF